MRAHEVAEAPCTARWRMLTLMLMPMLFAGPVLQYTTSSDVWSFAVLLWESFTAGTMPYPRKTNAQTRDYIEAGGRLPEPSSAPAGVYDIMMACWEYHPADRITFEEAHRRLYAVYQRLYAEMDGSPA